MSRQPVHTLYLGAHLFTRDSPRRLGESALRTLREHAPDPAALAEVFGLAPELAEAIYPRVIAKLEREPIEDLRLDFEDGYGRRPDDEEDGHARHAAAELAAGAMPPFTGIRLKCFAPDLVARALRTLELFVTTLAERSGRTPPGFVVTLAKVGRGEDVTVAAEFLDGLEARLGLAAGAVRLEIMVETPESIIGADGRVTLPALVAAARGRLRGAHFGTYDFTAACEIAAPHQGMRHPVCDFAKQVMKVALAGTDVWLSDGSTHVLPVGSAVRRAWRLHADDVRHSLVGGFYQGWDLHPAQLPSRFAALYAFFHEGLPAIASRAAVAEEPATRAALLGFVGRAVACGALTEAEARAV
jgi:citrate lyase beta subunit